MSAKNIRSVYLKPNLWRLAKSLRRQIKAESISQTIALALIRMDERLHRAK